MKKKIFTIIGARPQFIKSIVFSKELNKYSNFEEIIVHTGQHYDKNMSKIFFDELEIKKEDYNLNISGGSHAYQTGNMIIELEKIILKEKPDYVLLYGDTNSTLAGSLAASKLGVSIIHIEAGFRSFDRLMPEEINRVVTDHISSYLFCFTESSVDLLKKEGITKNVYNVGDITYEAALYFSKIAENKKKEFIEKFELDSEKYIYCTIHRPSNTDLKENLKDIFDSLIKSGEKIILPLHPRTKKKLIEFGLLENYLNKNIKIIEPVGYLESLLLCKKAKKIITDSGGVLREAYFFKKPCIILRENAEFIEALDNGEAILVGSDSKKIIDSILNFNGQGKFPNFFGEGDCSKKIMRILNGD